MLQTDPAGEPARGGGSGGRTVVVGVKMDSPCKELLTWALVKVAHPRDTVVALHVLGSHGRRRNSTFFFLLGFCVSNVGIDW